SASPVPDERAGSIPRHQQPPAEFAVGPTAGPRVARRRRRRRVISAGPGPRAEAGGAGNLPGTREEGRQSQRGLRGHPLVAGELDRVSESKIVRSGFKTVGDCPDFLVPWEKNGAVPFSQTSFETASHES